MNKWIPILSGLLVLQLALALGLNLAGDDYAAFEPTEKLLAADSETVDSLRIEDGEGAVLLTRRDGRWLLPERSDFPADQEAVKGLLQKLAGLEKGWPVATSAGALSRFKVADDAFERRVTLAAGGETRGVLYVGTSPGLRKVHVRPRGEEAVYAVSLDTWDVNAGPGDWIDKGVLTLDEAAVTRVELPGVTLERDGEAFRVAGLREGQTADEAQVRTLVNRLTRLRIEGLADADAVPKDKEPALTLTVTRGGGDPLTYRVWTLEEGADPVLTRSDFSQAFRVADFSVEPLMTASLDALVKAAGEPAAAATVAPPGEVVPAAATR